MKYVGKPVEVEAHKIVSTIRVGDGSEMDLKLSNGQTVVATADMLARMTPVPGDYWVIQEDGYTYLNPAHVFERKYQAVGFNKSSEGVAVGP